MYFQYVAFKKEKVWGGGGEGSKGHLREGSDTGAEQSSS